MLGVESIVDQDVVELCTKCKVWPVEAVGAKLILLDWVEVTFLWIIIVSAQIAVIEVERTADEHQSLHLLGGPFFVDQNWVIYVDATRFDASIDGYIEFVVIGAKDINIAIIVFGSHQDEMFAVLYDLPHILFLHVWNITLILTSQQVTFKTIWENHIFQRIADFDNVVCFVIWIWYRPGGALLGADVKYIDVREVQHLACYNTYKRLWMRCPHPLLLFLDPQVQVGNAFVLLFVKSIFFHNLASLSTFQRNDHQPWMWKQCHILRSWAKDNLLWNFNIKDLLQIDFEKWIGLVKLIEAPGDRRWIICR